MKASELAAKAASEMERRGYHSGDMGSDVTDPGGCKVCVVGAIFAAGNGNPFSSSDFSYDSWLSFDTVLDELRKVTFHEAVTGWSDEMKGYPNAARKIAATLRNVSATLAKREAVTA